MEWLGLPTGMRSHSLTRITFDGKGGTAAAERWEVGHQVRDLAVAPDGEMWLAEGGLNIPLKEPFTT